MPENMDNVEAMKGKPATGDPEIKTSIRTKNKIIKPINEKNKPRMLANLRGKVEKNYTRIL